MKTALSVALGAALLLGTSGIGSAAEPIATLQKIPEYQLTVLFTANAAPIGKDGYVGQNATSGWLGVGLQRGPMQTILAAAGRGDAAAVERNWQVIDVAFQHQQPDGDFEYAPVIDNIVQKPVYNTESVMAWIADSSAALLALRASSLGPQYASKIDALIPKYRLSLQWLAQPANVASLIRADTGAYNRLLWDAKAFYLGDKLVDMPSLRPIGNDFLTRSLGAQLPNGVFPERGGADTSYSAVSCLRLAEMSLFIDDSRMLNALETGANWELSQMHDNGSVETSQNTRTGNGREFYLGHAKGVNYYQVGQMFALAGALTGNSAYSDAATAVAHYIRAPKTPAPL